ncbi:MAG: flippase activity-associated protein Agl23 [Thermomicrobiales bacterium]
MEHRAGGAETTEDHPRMGVPSHADSVAAPQDASLLATHAMLPDPSVEMLLWVVVILSALLARVASLTNNAFGTAEAQRAYAAWQFVDGQSARVDGALWGPLPFLINAVFFFLFGARDAIARLGPALAGVAIVPICWWLRPYFGRWGALGVAALIALSPTFVYGSRHLSGVPYVLLAAFALFLCVLRLADERATTGTLAVAGIAIAFLIGSGPSGLTMLVAFAFALAILALLDQPDLQTGERHGALRSIGAHLRQVDRRIWWSVVALVGLLLLAACSLFFTDIVHLPSTLGSLFGRWWDDLFATTRNQPWYYYLLTAFVYEPFIGVAAIIGILLIARTAAPRPLAMTLPLTWQLVALVLFSLSGGKAPENAAMILLALALIGGTAIEWAAERLRGGWFWRERGWMLGVAACILALAVAQFIRQLLDVSRSAAWVATILVVIALLLVAGYATMTLINAQGTFRASTALLTTLLALSCMMAVRAMSDATFSHPADGHELLADGTAASVTPFVERVQRISIDLTRNDRTLDPATGDRHNIGGGNALAIGVDPSLEWPFRWYFRDFPNFTVADAQPLAAGRPLEADGTLRTRILIVPSSADAQIAPLVMSFSKTSSPATVSPAGAYRAIHLRDLPHIVVSGRSWANALRYMVLRRTTEPPTVQDLTLYMNKDAAARVLAGSGQPLPPNNLFDRAGKGAAAGQFDAARGIVIGPDGTITIVDQLNYRVQQFTPDGIFLRQWGGIGMAPDTFGKPVGGLGFGPTGLAIAPDGTIFVADTWNHRIAVFTRVGKPLRQWGKYFNGQENPAALPQHTAEFYGPRGIAIAPNGLLYITDTGNSRILVFDKTGAFVRTFGSFGTGDGQMDNPVGIAARADGTIAVADTNNARVLLFTADGAYLGAVPVPDWATVKGLEAYPCFLPNGNLLVPSPTTNQLIEMTIQGQTVRGITGNTGDLHKPVAVAVTPDGASVYVVNDDTNTVVRVNAR